MKGVLIQKNAPCECSIICFIIGLLLLMQSCVNSILLLYLVKVKLSFTILDKLLFMIKSITIHQLIICFVCKIFTFK